MTKKLVTILLFIFLLSEKLFAQSFMHSLGANISIMKTTVKNSDGSRNYTFLMTITHLSYFPRFNLTESENSSLSIGSPLGAGINIVNDAFSGTGLAWGFDLPLVVDYNMGCKSTNENENNFGGYFGAGFGYMYTSWTFDGATADKANSYGPLARAGIRFGSPNADWHVAVGIYFKEGLEKQKFKTFGFNVLSDF